MDPITHTLLGATLADTRLGRTTRHATAVLVVGANLPDVDVLSYFMGGDFALGFRRGPTHGVPALLVLPALLGLAAWLWGRWRPARPGAPPLSVPWLFALAYLAVVSHPALDWLNTYGMRWWMPFDGSWTYGDSVFIVDPWLWLVLGGVWLLGRRPSIPVAVAGIAVAILLIAATARRAPALLPVVSLLLLALAALAWSRFEAVARRRSTWAAAALAVAGLYVGALLVLQPLSERAVTRRLADEGISASELMVGPTPANPLLWDVVARDGDAYRTGRLSWPAGAALSLVPRALPAADAHPLWPSIVTRSDIRGFLGWARFPWLEVETTPTGRRVWVMDARYARARTDGFGGARIDLPEPAGF